MVMLNGLALSRMVMSLFEIGQQSMTQFTVFLWTRSPTPWSWMLSWPLQNSRWPSCVLFSPALSNRDSQSPSMFQSYLFISCWSSSSFSTSFSVLTFQVPMVMLRLAQMIFFGTPVIHFSPTRPWCTAGGAVLGDPGDDWSGMVLFLADIPCGDSWAMSLGGAHPSPSQTTAEILQLGGSLWSRTLDWRWLQPGRWPHRGSSFDRNAVSASPWGR